MSADNQHPSGIVIRDIGDRSSGGTSTWYVPGSAGESSVLRGRVKVLPAPAPGEGARLRLQPPPARREDGAADELRVVSIRFWRDEEQEPDRAPRGRLFLPCVVLAAVSVLGYFTAVRSVTAFQSAWKRADTRQYWESAKADATFHPEDGDIPGPFSRVPSGRGGSVRSSTVDADTTQARTP